MSTQITWQELANRIAGMSDEQRQDHIAAYVQSMDEFFPVTLAITSEDEDVLSPNQFYLDVEG